MRKPVEVKAEMDKLDISIKERILTGLLSLLTGLLVVSGPIVVLANLMIYIDYAKLLLAVIGLLSISGLLLADYLFLRSISKGEVKSIYSLMLIDGIIIVIAITILMIIIAIKGGLV